MAAKTIALKPTTLHDFLDQQGRGSHVAMARALGVSKVTVSCLSKGTRGAEDRIYASYAMAKRICGYVETFGYKIDIETLVRTDGEARP